MARRCKCLCGGELLAAAKCTNIIEKKGYASIQCLAAHEKAKRLAKDAKAIKVRNTTLKKKVKSEDRGLAVKAAQTAFNTFIRLRDKDLPCISCGSMPNDNNLITGSRWDCGHYRSVGANPELRFEELNAAKQCVKCNRDLSGNVANYRVEHIKRIGVEAIEWVEGPHKAKRYSIADLNEIEAKYKLKIKHKKRDS